MIKIGTFLTRKDGTIIFEGLDGRREDVTACALDLAKPTMGGVFNEFPIYVDISEVESFNGNQVTEWVTAIRTNL
jgi:hypothetical protein